MEDRSSPIERRLTECWLADLKALIATFPDDSKMIKHKPPIKGDAASNRVPEERRNVRVSAFLYAASREDDNDFHLIIGTDPKSAKLVCMTMEISGLPPKKAASFALIKKARDDFKNLTMPDGTRYTILETNQTDPYDPPQKRSRRGT